MSQEQNRTVQNRIGRDYWVARHKSSHTFDAEVSVGIVGRACTADHLNHTAKERMDRTLERWAKFKSEVSLKRFKYSSKTVVARDARRCLLSGIQLLTHGDTFTLSQQGSFLIQSKGGQKVQITRGRNRETLKIV